MTVRIALLDLQRAVSANTVTACCDDDGDGIADSAVITDLIGRANAMVNSWLYGVGLPVDNTTTDILLKEAELQYAIYFMFERHPEYVRVKDPIDRANRLKTVQSLCERIKSGQQVPVETVKASGTPRPYKGVTIDSGHRMLVDSPDGSSNQGDF